MFTLDEVPKYIATRGSIAEGEMLIEKKHTTCKKVSKSLAPTQAFQARIYNKSHRDKEYKVGQKVRLRVKIITIERSSPKQD